MKLLLNLLLENWPYLAPLLYEVIARLWPTKWNISILDGIWKIVNALLPNNRTPDGTEQIEKSASGIVMNKIKVKTGRHILHVLIPLILAGVFVSQNSHAQIWQNYKGIRLVNNSDTTKQLPVQGSIFFDDVENTFYGHNGIGWKKFGVGVQNFWPLSGSATFIAPVAIDIAGHRWDIENGVDDQISFAPDFFQVTIGQATGTSIISVEGGTNGINILSGASGPVNILAGGGINGYNVDGTRGLFTGKHFFTPTATNAGINIGTLAGEPSALAVGDMWFNSLTSNYKVYKGTGTTDIISNSGNSTLNNIPFFSTTGNATTTSENDFQYLTGTNQILLTNVAATHVTSIFGGEIQFDKISAPVADVTINNSGFSVTGNIPYSINSDNNLSISASNDVSISATNNTGVVGNIIELTSTSSTILHDPNVNAEQALTIGPGDALIGVTLKSDIFTPTLGNATNITASGVVASSTTFTRIGNIVTMQGAVSVTATTTGLTSRLTMTLPVVTNSAVMSGFGITFTAAENDARITSVLSGTQIAQLEFIAVSTTANQWNYTLQYLVQ